MISAEKVLFVIGGLKAGGAEKVCVTLINEFYRRGHNIELLVLNTDKAMMKRFLAPGINVIDLKVKHTKNSFFLIKKVLKKKGFTKCLVFNFQLTIVFILLKRMYGLKFTLYARGISTFSEKIKIETNLWHKYINGFLIKKLYRKADYFIAQSSGMKVDMAEFMHVPSEKIKIIFNPISEFSSDLIRSKEKRQLPPNINELLFVGSLKAAKNIPFMLQSVKELLKIRKDVILRIVGEGPLFKESKKLAQKLNIIDHVVFEGLSENPEVYYTNADLFLLTSWYEGFPNVLVEALSFGVPVISINCNSGPADIIADNINGYLVDGYNSTVFASKIDLALNKQWDKEIIAGSIEKFSFQRIYNQYENLLYNN